MTHIQYNAEHLFHQIVFKIGTQLNFFTNLCQFVCHLLGKLRYKFYICREQICVFNSGFCNKILLSMVSVSVRARAERSR